jgi:chemotaxis protein methyltransferase CheR
MSSAGLLPENYRFLQDYIRRESGIVIESEKEYLLDARLSGLARESGLGSLNDLCALLRATAPAPLRRRVVEALTTNETYFFREPAQFEALRNVVLPELRQQRQATHKMSFWSAAASTGQEAYTLAILLHEMGLDGWNIDILATDFSTQVLDRARSGQFSQLEVNRGLPAPLLLKYFRRNGLHWEIKNELKRMVRFEQTDLRTSKRAYGPFDVVFCRNVLIYFDMATKRKILEEVHGTLFRGGFLLLGATETGLPPGEGMDTRFRHRSIGDVTFYEAL